VVRFLFQFWHDTGTRGTNVDNCVINARLKLELSVNTIVAMRLCTKL